MGHKVKIECNSKQLTQISICFVLICTSIIVNHDYAQAKEANPDHKNTPKLDSGLTLERFDRSVRPQDDFYRFVNGHWLDTFVLPPEKSRYGVFNDLSERARKQLKAIILE